MTETLFALIADYGFWVVFTITFLSCLALPVPSSLVMLTAGAFAAAGDLVLTQVLLAAFVGAVLGDNSGYWLARAAGGRLSDWLATRPRRRALMDRARSFMDLWGGSSVFFSCWLVAPLGPYVNYVSGLTRFRWLRFALWGVAGEIVWVGLYVSLGYIFGNNITALSSLLGNISGMLVAAVAVIGLGYALCRPHRETPPET